MTDGTKNNLKFEIYCQVRGWAHAAEPRGTVGKVDPEVDLRGKTAQHSVVG